MRMRYAPEAMPKCEITMADLEWLGFAEFRDGHVKWQCGEFDVEYAAGRMYLNDSLLSNVNNVEQLEKLLDALLGR